MTSNKVIILGIDGLDANLIQRFQDDLPNFSKLIKKSPITRMSSVFPPDSPTAWASIFTGLDPAKHGIVSFKDPFSHSKIGDYSEKIKNITGRTFWDLAGKYGKKCCIVFPHMAFPPWPVNGILVSRTTEVDLKKFDVKTYPPDLSLGCSPLDLKPITSFPVDISHVIQPTKKLIQNETNFGIRLMENSDWDVFFIYFSSADNIQHLFWMAFDETHPAYPDMQQYRQVIPDIYKFYDEHVIGRFLKSAPTDATIIVLSDHGHGLRPFNLVNINEFLARSGFLKTKIKSSNALDSNYLKALAKRKITKIINERRIIAKGVSKFLSIFPESLELYTGTSPIDWEQSNAYLSDCSAGLKAYSYAGIRVKKDINPQSYEQIRQSLIDLLLSIKDPSSSKKLVEWAIRREELYDGPYLTKYPDVLFKLEGTWGVGWEINGEQYGKSISHKLFSGTHKKDSAVFLISRPKTLSLDAKKIQLTDITPTILDLLGIDDTKLYESFDGKSILTPQ